MPYINSNVTVKLTDDQKDKIKTRIGKAMNEVPGKSEQWLFVGFHGEYTLYFRGELQHSAAVIEVKIFGTQPRDVKDEFTAKLSTIFKEEAGISPENIYVIYTEVEDGNWGWNGGLF